MKMRLQSGLRATSILFFLPLLVACAGEGLQSPLAEPGLCLPSPPSPAGRLRDGEMAYFGCSNELNLRAMLEQPQDLERGRPLAPSNGIRESGVVELYESGPRKALGGAGPAAPTLVLTGPEGAGK